MNDFVLITGGTGLVGSNAALLARQRGMRVKVLVRSSDGLEPLTGKGVEIAEGDVTDPASLDRALDGVNKVIHTAALLGGTWSKYSREAFWAVNHQGTLNVLDAARKAGIVRSVVVDTHGIMDPSFTHTERSPIVLMDPGNSPYLQSKRAGYYGALYRAALGQEICFVTPGEIYGPGVFVERALDPTSFTSALLRGMRGEMDRFVAFPMFWTFALDVSEACLRALERGERGRRYLVMGRNEDVTSLAGICNLGNEIAGLSHRMRDVSLTDTDAPEMGTLRHYAEKTYAVPYIDDQRTRTALAFEPTPLKEGLKQTVAWARAAGKLP